MQPFQQTTPLVAEKVRARLNASCVCRGKKKYDKRQDIKKRDQQRDSQRETKTRFK